MNFATLCAAFCLLSAAPAALAQNSAAQPAPYQAAGTPQSAPPDTARPEVSTDEQASSFPILAVTGVEILRSRLKPEMDVIAARGLTSTGGWLNGELIPLTKGAPPDAVLDLVFVAEPPPETGAPLGHAPIHAILPLSPDHPFKAVRIRAATNSLTLKELPGSVEASVPPDPSRNSIGKYLVEKGAAAPAGVP